MTARDDTAKRRAGDLFSGRVLVAIVAIGILAFVGTVYLTVFSDGGEPSFEVSPTTYSSSALGHKAFLQILRRLGEAGALRNLGEHGHQAEQLVSHLIVAGVKNSFLF